MSWSVTAAGKAADVKVQFAKKVSEIKVHQSASTCTILDGHVAAVEATCDANPEHVIIAESNGHIDSTSGGDANLKLRKVWN